MFFISHLPVGMILICLLFIIAGVKLRGETAVSKTVSNLFFSAAAIVVGFIFLKMFINALFITITIGVMCALAIYIVYLLVFKKSNE